MVKYLVEQGADINSGNGTIFDYLLHHGMIKDIDDFDHTGRSLLNIACCGGNTVVVYRRGDLERVERVERVERLAHHFLIYSDSR